MKNKNNNLLKMMLILSFVSLPAFAVPGAEPAKETNEAYDETNMDESSMNPAIAKMADLSKKEEKMSDPEQEPAKKKVSFKAEAVEADDSDFKAPSSDEPSDKSLEKPSPEMDDKFVTEMIKRDNKMKREDQSSFDETPDMYSDESREINMPSSNTTPAFSYKGAAEAENRPAGSVPVASAMPLMPMPMQMPMSMMSQVPMPMPIMSMPQQQPMMMTAGSIDPNMIFYYAYNATVRAIQDSFPQIISSFQKMNQPFERSGL